MRFQAYSVKSSEENRQDFKMVFGYTGKLTPLPTDSTRFHPRWSPTPRRVPRLVSYGNRRVTVARRNNEYSGRVNSAPADEFSQREEFFENGPRDEPVMQTDRYPYSVIRRKVIAGDDLELCRIGSA